MHQNALNATRKTRSRANQNDPQVNDVQEQVCFVARDPSREMCSLGISYLSLKLNAYNNKILQNTLLHLFYSLNRVQPSCQQPGICIGPVNMRHSYLHNVPSIVYI